jgi:acyl carrier protein
VSECRSNTERSTSDKISHECATLPLRFRYPFENLFGELPGLSVSIVATKDANLKPSAGRVTRVTMQQVMSTTERALSVDAGIDADVPLIETGLDSLASSELTDNLQKLVGAELPGTLLFDAPTVRQTFAFLEAMANEEQDGAERVVGDAAALTAEATANEGWVISLRLAALLSEDGVFDTTWWALPMTEVEASQLFQKHP